MASLAYGLTPWGAWFAEALAGFDENGRLSRGKSYANTGKVASIDFLGGSAIAKVRGRSRPWYSVRIDFPPLEAAAKERLFALIEREPLLLARIEAGELPAELIERLKKARIELICKSWASMKRRCDCPDWGDPCKHMAAVYYLIAQEVDRDPALLFRLRGVDLAARFGRSEPGDKPAGLAPPLSLRPLDPGREPEVGPEAYEPPRLDSYLGLVSSLIPPATPFAGADFASCLVEFYHRAAVEDPAGPEFDAGLERAFSGSTFALEILGDEGRKTPSLDAVERSIGLPIVVAVTDPVGRVRRFKAADLAALFLGFEDGRGTPGYRYFFHLSRLAYAAWRGSAFVPTPSRGEAGLRVAWIALPAARELSRALDSLGSLDPGLLSARPPGERRARPIVGGGVARLLASSILSDWVKRLGFRPSKERAALRPLVDLFFAGASIDIGGPGARLLPQAIASWLSILSMDFSSSEFRYRLEIAELPGASAEEAERFAIGMSVSMGGDVPGGGKPVALKDAAAKFGGLEALRVPTALSAYVPEIRRLASEKRVVLERPRLAGFLGDGASILRRLGVELVLPKALLKALSPRLVLQVKAKPAAARSLRSYLELLEVVEYDWKIALGDRLLSPAEFARLVRDKKDIVFFHDGFLRVDPVQVASLLERARSGRGSASGASPSRRLTALDLLAARLTGDAAFSADAEELAASLFAERDEALPAGLRAGLRPYQERGYRWIMSNLRSGFGCILADDMGLGKTVQAIAAMQRLTEDGLAGDGVLVVAPAALLTNWERELARFAPGLPVSRYHGPGRRLREGPGVRLTTYDTLARDAGKLAERNFSLLVCDEAQLVKNAEARRSRGVKSIRSAYRLALSGTPVENRLEDLRSIFDAVLPGYLGGPSEFTRRWRAPIEIDRDREAAERLKRVTAPFLLRRLKTDQDIAPDLPAKVISDEYARLAPGQAALYQNVVSAGLKKAEGIEPGLRKAALVLELITSLKQVCDHPRVYDKESPPKAALSGKCALLIELLGEMLANREKVLVFSQYVETLGLLRTVIRDELSEDCLVYHGGMGKKARDGVVDRFQNEGSARVMLVSLRAGGLGLNLTAASRVIHYDLWFNPAVESQATDRAFRIGQSRDVFVHRLISAGTFEEKIDAMLKDKAILAGMTVASGESWLAKLDSAQLREIFAR